MALPARGAAASTLPVLTAAVTGVTAIVSVTGLLVEPVLLALRRDPAALADGQLWRLLTALLVQDGGIPGTVFNLIGLVAVGIAAERRLGQPGWVAGYLAGGLTGEIVGWAGWQPIGAGNSVGVCGLAAMLAVALLGDGIPADGLTAVAPATWAAALSAGTVLTGALTGVVPTVAALGAGAAVARAPRLAALLPVVVVLVAAAVLLAGRDIHGAALAAGLLVGGVRWAVRPHPEP